MKNKVDQPPSQPSNTAQKKPYSMGLPPLARQPYLQPKPLWEKVPEGPKAAKVGSRSRG